jgi:hypothetical protein
MFTAPARSTGRCRLRPALATGMFRHLGRSDWKDEQRKTKDCAGVRPSSFILGRMLTSAAPTGPVPGMPGSPFGVK